MDYGTDSAYADSRLAGTWLATKGEDKKLFRIEEVLFDGQELKAYVTGKRATTSIVRPLNHFSFSPPPLGYFQMDNYCIWVCRAAMRRDYRQGIRPANLLACRVMDGRVQNRAVNAQGMISHDNMYAIEQAVNNKYASFSEALEMVDDYFISAPFSRDFALAPTQGGRRTRLIYCGSWDVGDVTGDGIPVLKDEYQFLKEELDESLGLEPSLCLNERKPAKMRRILDAA